MADFIIQELYDGDIKMRFYPNSHKYKIDGTKEWLVSATAITGIVGGDKINLLSNWAQNQYQKAMLRWLEGANDPLHKVEIEEAINLCRSAAEQEKDRTADVGTIVHDYAEAFGKARKAGEPVPPLPETAPEEAYKGIEAFLTWVKNNDVKFLETERLVYSKKHGYVGTLDLLAEVNGKVTLVDYKTGKYVYDEHYYQVAGYKMAWEEEKEKVKAAMILHFDRETGMLGEYPLSLKECNHNGKMFLHLLAIKNDLKVKARNKKSG